MPRRDDPAPTTAPADDVARPGMTRKVDDLGRVVLPADFRRALGIREGDPVDVSVHGDRIVLRRTVESCVFCGTDIDLFAFRDKQVCLVCRKSLAQHLD